MLHGLAGLIFGSKSPSSSEIAESPAGRENIRDAMLVNNTNNSQGELASSKNDELEIVDGDDEEWLMVDVRRDDNVCSATTRPVVDFELDLALPLSADVSSGESSPSSDERGGWNLTPPPCFTASFRKEIGFGGVVGSSGDEKKKNKTKIEKDQLVDDEALRTVLETSNFENLLIEHPSMSVYGRIINTQQSPRRVSATVVVSQGLQKTNDEKKSVNRSNANAVVATESAENSEQRPRQAEVFLRDDSLRWQRLDAQQQLERALKAKSLGGNNRMRRSNAVAAAPQQCGSGSPRKRRMKNHPSGRCNDRKCQ